jgi:hypothetical protein
MIFTIDEISPGNLEDVVSQKNNSEILNLLV